MILDNFGWFLLVLKELVKKQHFLTLSKNEIEKLANLQCLQEIAINAYFFLLFTPLTSGYIKALNVSSPWKQSVSVLSNGNNQSRFPRV